MIGQSAPMVRLALFLFRRLIALMPRTYGQQQRADAVQLTAALARDAYGRRGNAGVVDVMFSALLDLIIQIVRERLRPRCRSIAHDRRSLRDRLVLITDAAVRDLHHGFRSMGAKPSHSAAVIATLALGIGLNAAVFSVVDWVLLRPMPYPSPDELVRVWVSDKASFNAPSDLTHSEVEILSKATTLRAAAAFSTVTRVTSGQDLDPIHVVVARVTGDLFRVLASYPIIGRAFDARELESGSPVVVLSHSLWRSRFASDPAIIGRVIAVDNQPHTIVGVMPAGRGYPRDAELWRPSRASEREDNDREYVMIARLAVAIDHATAMGELATLAQSADTTMLERVVWVDGLHATEVRDVRAALTWVLAAAALVLVIACANVAALIGTQGMDRAGELAVRGALGASRSQVARQLLVEGILMASAGGALGIIVGVLALDLLVALAPGGLPRLHEITLDGRVITAGVIVTLLVGVLVSLAAAWRAARVDLRATLNAAGCRLTARVGTRRFLVTVQVAVAVVLTIGAGLLTRSLQHLMTLDHGFDAEGLVAVSLNLRGTDPTSARKLFRTLVEASESVGVRSAAVAFRLPTEVSGLRIPVRIDDMLTSRASSVVLRLVTPRYFETIRIPLVEGRALAATDTRERPRVAVVNRAFVREVLGGSTAIDMRLTTDLVEGRVTIVGVVGDVTPAGQADRPALYMSFDQFAINAGTLIVRGDGDPSMLVPALRSRIRSVAPALPLDRIQTIDEILAAGRSVVRFNSLLASSFGVLALILAMIGVFGLTSREVVVRRHESGVRTALGATRRAVMWGLIRPITRLMLFGLVVGVALAGAMTTSMRSLLYGISPVDPLTFMTVPVLIALVAAAAALAAAWRVRREDPATTLRA